MAGGRIVVSIWLGKVDNVQCKVHSCEIRFADGFKVTGIDLHLPILNLSPQATPQLFTLHS